MRRVALIAALLALAGCQTAELKQVDGQTAALPTMERIALGAQLGLVDKGVARRRTRRARHLDRFVERGSGLEPVQIMRRGGPAGFHTGIGNDRLLVITGPRPGRAVLKLPAVNHPYPP